MYNLLILFFFHTSFIYVLCTTAVYSRTNGEKSIIYNHNCSNVFGMLCLPSNSYFFILLYTRCTNSNPFIYGSGAYFNL